MPVFKSVQNYAYRMKIDLKLNCQDNSVPPFSLKKQKSIFLKLINLHNFRPGKIINLFLPVAFRVKLNVSLS